jgi:hypothetical protein
MELAREVVPSAATIGVLANSIDPKGPPQWHELEAAGQLNVIAADVRTPDDLDARCSRTGIRQSPLNVVASRT